MRKDVVFTVRAQGSHDILALYVDRASAEQDLAGVGGQEACEVVSLDLLFPPSNPCMDDDWVGGLDNVFEFAHVTYSADGDRREACVAGDAVAARVTVALAERDRRDGIASVSVFEHTYLGGGRARYSLSGEHPGELSPLAEEMLGYVCPVNAFFVQSLVDAIVCGADEKCLRPEPSASQSDARKMQMSVFGILQCYWDRLSDKVGLGGSLDAELEGAEDGHQRKVAMNLLAAAYEMEIPYPRTAVQMVREGDFPECWRRASYLWE